MGRPSKFPKFFEQMKVVVNDPRSVTLTDIELCVAINSLLPAKERVSQQTFAIWRQAKLNPKSPENTDSISAEDAAEFRQVLQMARVTQKMALTGEMLNNKNKNQWGASWLLERKFDDLKLTQKAAVGEGTTNIQINVSNSEHKSLIEGILGGNLEASNSAD